jgi:hypothetical protein
MRSACAVLYYLWPAWLYKFFHIISYAARFSGGEGSYSAKNVFWFSLQLLSEEKLSEILSSLHIKCPLFLSDFNEPWIFSTYFRKILKYQISWKSVQWEPSCSMRIDRQTYMMKLIVTFRNFAGKRPKPQYTETENITTKHFHYQYQPVMIAVYPQNAEF